MWGQGLESSSGETAFVAIVGVVVAILVVVAIYYVSCYVTQRRDLYISCRGPELLISEVLVNVLCAGVVLAREVMTLHPSGRRLSCTVTRLAALLHFCVNNMSQVTVVSATRTQQMTRRTIPRFCIPMTIRMQPMVQSGGVVPLRITCPNPSSLPLQTVRWCLVVMKFDASLHSILGKWIATSRKRLTLLVAMCSLGSLWTVLLSYRHPCLQV
jgi:hypothetical protein